MQYPLYTEVINPSEFRHLDVMTQTRTQQGGELCHHANPKSSEKMSSNHAALVQLVVSLTGRVRITTTLTNEITEYDISVS